jgi:hypothetical protein
MFELPLLKMKTVSSIIALCSIFLFSCSDDDLNVQAFTDDASIETINGTWKVESYEDLQAGTIEYQTQENSWGYDIILTFDDTAAPKSFSGQVTSNSVAGQFEYTGERRLKILQFGSTYVNQPEWGNRFGTALGSEELTFRVNSQQLRVLYEGETKSVTFRKQ